MIRMIRCPQLAFSCCFEVKSLRAWQSCLIVLQAREASHGAYLAEWIRGDKMGLHEVQQRANVPVAQLRVRQKASCNSRRKIKSFRLLRWLVFPFRSSGAVSPQSSVLKAECRVWRYFTSRFDDRLWRWESLKIRGWKCSRILSSPRHLRDAQRCAVGCEVRRCGSSCKHRKAHPCSGIP